MKIEVKNKTFYVLIGNVFAVYDSKDEAVKDLKEEMKENENAAVAVINYKESKDKNKQGTFDVTPISWKEIAMGWIK